MIYRVSVFQTKINKYLEGQTSIMTAISHTSSRLRAVPRRESRLRRSAGLHALPAGDFHREQGLGDVQGLPRGARVQRRPEDQVRRRRKVRAE